MPGPTHRPPGGPPCQGAGGQTGIRYTYAELEGLWINAGGSPKIAPVMAAIAEAESGGCSAAFNPSGATGLWQILGNPFPGDAYDPATNAKMAVSKYQSQGLDAWVTYTSGAYKAFLNPGTTPDRGVPSPGGGPQPGPGSNSPDCLFPPSGGLNIPVVPGLYTQTVNLPCLFTKSNARAFLGVGLMIGGWILIQPGAALLIAAAGTKALGFAGPVLEKTGAAVAFIPGAEAAGVAIAGTGKASTSSAQETQRRRRSAGASAGARNVRQYQRRNPRQ